MKISLALLLLLLAAACTSSQGMSFLSSRSTCCSKEKFHRQRIREFRIQGYQETAPNCTHKAVFVKLRNGAVVCVDPKEKWFQDYLKKQKKLKSTST
ncbi:CCL13 protein, partial [Acrocephalus arundinaceus]|nr:CCL13 protein [Acrocephalus arundinaceus]